MCWAKGLVLLSVNGTNNMKSENFGKNMIRINDGETTYKKTLDINSMHDSPVDDMRQQVQKKGCPEVTWG